MSTIIEEKASGIRAAKGEYLAPKVKVVNVKCRQVICQSNQDLRYGGFSNGEQEGY